MAFTIHEQFLQTDADGGFRSAVAELLSSGRLEQIERSRFHHRVTTTGEPIHYELLVGATAR